MSTRKPPLRVLSETIWIDRSRGWAHCAALPESAPDRGCYKDAVGNVLGVNLCRVHSRVALRRGVQLVEPSDIGMITPGNRETMALRGMT